MGVPVEVGIYGGELCGIDESFFRKSDIRDVLDAITLIYQFGIKRRSPQMSESWRDAARRIFKEENLRYEIDDLGGVHFHVDAAFAGVVASAIAVLGAPRYANVLANFDAAIRSLDAASPDAKSAVRSTFSAAEGLFRLMFSNAARLGGAEVELYLPPKMSVWYPDPTARRAASKLVASFKDWIDGAHFYRHEPGQEEPAQPPIEVAVLVINQGAGFIRWLAELDTKNGGAS